ncbi:hypothetical protein [Streptomyces sp. NPDC005955]|uniref:hypothetical protein n=1 Tax=Streptomyces sp. NPDC005955 TaxID=3364738 RepID=UPI0036B4935E
MTVRRLALAFATLVVSGFLIGAAGQLAKIVIPEDRASSSVSAMNKAELVG